MDLTVAIPVYQWAVRPLVEELNQGWPPGLQGEILLWDDGSDPEIRAKNRPLAQSERVVYREMPENLGRASIRNLLAKAAQGRYILFLDNDSRLAHQNFLQTYWSNRLAGGVCCGGRRYPAKAAKGQSLHLRYGKGRESKSLSQRFKDGYEGFQSNNFLVDRRLWGQIRFDERLKNYGHEDTLFGRQLAAQGIALKQIENPVWHSQLEEKTVFLAKTRQALDNLDWLARNHPLFQSHPPRLWLTAQKWREDWRGKILVRVFEKGPRFWEKALDLPGISLPLFDLYRLAYLLRMPAQ